MNRTELRKKLIGTSIEDRVLIIKEYLQELPEEEVQKYRKFYDASVQALMQNKGVTRAENRLQRTGYFDSFGRVGYSTLHQIACVAAEQPIRTPKMEMENKGVRTESTLRTNDQGKSVSKLMSMSRNVVYIRRFNKTKD